MEKFTVSASSLASGRSVREGPIIDTYTSPTGGLPPQEHGRGFGHAEPPHAPFTRARAIGRAAPRRAARSTFLAGLACSGALLALSFDAGGAGTSGAQLLFKSGFDGAITF